jgi:multiple sugar transport system permease protein
MKAVGGDFEMIGTASGMKRNETYFTIFRYVLLTLFAVSMFLPLFWMLTMSLKGEDTVFMNPPEWIPREFHFDNYARAIDYMHFGRVFINSACITLMCALGAVVSNLIVGYAIARLKFPGRKVWFYLIIGSMMLPSFVGLIPVFKLFSSLGMYNTWLPLILPAFLGSPFFVFLLRQFFLGIPMSYDESAKIDGASHLQILFRILAPMIKPAIIVIVIMQVQASWSDYLNPLIWLPDEAKWTIPLAIQSFTGSYATQWNYFMAADMLYMLPILVLFLFAQKYFMQGLGSLNNAGLK